MKFVSGGRYHMNRYFAQINRREDPRFKGKQTEGTAVRGPLPLVELIEDGTLAQNIAISLQRILLGFLGGSLIGDAQFAR